MCCPRCGYEPGGDRPFIRGAARFSRADGLTYAGQAVRLEPVQRIIVETLLKARGRAVSADILVDRISTEAMNGRNIVQAAICRARRALRPLGADRHIQTTMEGSYRWID